jgi:hypothetical protein
MVGYSGSTFLLDNKGRGLAYILLFEAIQRVRRDRGYPFWLARKGGRL